MIPLASDLLPFPGQMRREDLLKVRQSARPAFFIRPRNDSGHCFLEVSRGTSRSVDKSPAMWQSSHRKQALTTRLGNRSFCRTAALELGASLSFAGSIATYRSCAGGSSRAAVHYAMASSKEWMSARAVRITIRSGGMPRRAKTYW